MNEFNYNEAMTRLETILSELEDGKKSVDELAELVHEATLLVKNSRTKLKTTEEEIQKAFEGS
jgi:exodeoxyribonuclease VII small subunit